MSKLSQQALVSGANSVWLFATSGLGRMCKKFLSSFILIAALLSIDATHIAGQLFQSRQVEAEFQKRHLEALLKTIGESDNGYFEVLQYRGMVASGAESRSRMKQILQDRRVHLAYEKLKAMSAEEAANVIDESFDSEFKRLKSLHKNYNFEGPVVYGLHAKLWLSSRFSPRKKFNQHFGDWNSWSTREFYKGRFSKAGGMLHPSTFRPELLMYVNLALANEVEQEVDLGNSELLSIFAAVGNAKPLKEMFQTVSVSSSNSGDVSGDPLLTYPLFLDWNGLDTLDQWERADVMRKVQKLMDPPNAIEEIFSKIFENLEEIFAFREIAQEIERRQKVGVIVEFVGATEDRFGKIRRGWTTDMPPTKSDFLAAVDDLKKRLTTQDHAKLSESLTDIKDWVRSLPATGIDATNKKIDFRWPQDSDPQTRTELFVRASFRQCSALDGESSPASVERQTKTNKRGKN